MMSDAQGIPDAPGRGMREPGSDPSALHITQQTMEMRLVGAEAFHNNCVPFLNDPLKEYHHGSPELAAMPYVAASELAFIVVPAVGFDVNGNRLGYGAGNYDRYLCQLTDACHVVGVAFAEQRLAPIPAESHDIPLPFVTSWGGSGECPKMRNASKKGRIPTYARVVSFPLHTPSPA